MAHLLAEDAATSQNSVQRYKLEVDDTPRQYRRHFYGREHHNFYAMDEAVGPLILSVRTETISSAEHYRVMLRTRAGTAHEIVPRGAMGTVPAASRMARLLCDAVSTEAFHTVAFPGGSELVLNYDEHVISNRFKFGVIYQRRGQTREEQLFGNAHHSTAMDEFLDLLGERVTLRGFGGYRGGLDTTRFCMTSCGTAARRSPPVVMRRWTFAPALFATCAEGRRRSALSGSCS